MAILIINNSYFQISQTAAYKAPHLEALPSNRSIYM